MQVLQRPLTTKRDIFLENLHAYILFRSMQLLYQSPVVSTMRKFHHQSDRRCPGTLLSRGAEILSVIKQTGISHAVDYLLTFCVVGVKVCVGDGNAGMSGQITRDCRAADRVAIYVRGKGMTEPVNSAWNTDAFLLGLKALPERIAVHAMPFL